MPLNISIRHNPYLRYFAPFFVFIAISTLQEHTDNAASFWAFYGIKIAVTLAVFVFFFTGHWKEIEGRFDLKAVCVGLVVLGVWLAGCQLSANGASAPFEPAILAICIKLAGSIIVVPLIEEITFRSFLMRALIDEKFLSVPIGSYSFYALWINVLFFALLHPVWQWPVAAFAGIAYSAYLIKTKNLVGCIVAHATTNLGLGIYVLITKDWALWV